jgi:hypothetical protein
MPRRRAATSEAAEFASTLPESYLMCRDAGHAWRPYSADWSGEWGCWERSLVCQRCSTIRRQRLSRLGSVLGGHYEYPEGYQHKGLGRLDGSDRDALRLESLHRVFGADDELAARRRKGA